MRGRSNARAAGFAYRHRISLCFLACIAAVVLFIDIEIVWDNESDAAPPPRSRTEANHHMVRRSVRATVPLAAASSAPSPGTPARSRPPPSAPSIPSAAITSPYVALGMAVNLLPSAMLAYVRSLHAVSTAEIVIFVDKLPDVASAGSLASATDLARVRWEVFDPQALPLPWKNYHPSNARMYLYQRFLRAEAVRRAAARPPLPAYRCVQVSDVRDVAFQSDPFVGCDAPAWRGVHVNLEEPSIRIGSEPYNSKWVKDCYGAAVLSAIGQNTVSCSGYLIGSAVEMGQYVDAMAAELVKHGVCESNGIDQGVHNVLLYAAVRARGGDAAALKWVKHSNAMGPVWTGGYATKGVYKWDDAARGDAANMVVPASSASGGGATIFAVLHQYDRHDEILRRLCRRWIPERTQCGKEADKAEMLKLDMQSSASDVARCDFAHFDMRPGDLMPSTKSEATLKDFAHMSAAQQERCCGACLGDERCKGWVFRAGGEGGGHCWLKRATGAVSAAQFVPGPSGLVAALRKVRSAAPARAAQRRIAHFDAATAGSGAAERRLPPNARELDCSAVHEDGRTVSIPATATATASRQRALRLLVMLSPSLPEWRRTMGRSGEVLVLESIKRAVCELGWSMVEVVDFKWDSDPRHVEALCMDATIDAVVLEWDEPGAAFNSPCRAAQPVLVPDFFGFAEAKKHPRLELKHYLTMHPIAGNTFIGCVAAARTSAPSRA